VEATRRFSRAQIDNFMRRTEQLHGGGSGDRLAMGIRLQLRDRINGRPGDPAYRDPTDPVDPAGAAGVDRAGAEGDGAASDMTGGRAVGQVGFWTGGAIEIGTRDATARRDKINATTSGLSGGADIRLSEGLTIGLGGGYGADTSRIDGGAARVTGKSKVIAAYASAAPAPDAFIDGVVAYGDLDFRTRRIVDATGATARGRRDGEMTFASIAAGIDRTDGSLRWSAYGRGEYLDSALDAYAEAGGGRFDLRFDRRKVRSFLGIVGGKISFTQPVSFGRVTPRLGAEWRHEFNSSSIQRLDYADIAGNAIFGVNTLGWSREQYELTVGSRLDLRSQWSIDLEMGLRAASGERAGNVRIQISKEF